MMRLLLPLTLGVLVIYIIVIPFYFFEPFNNRDVLIVYNLMLFAIMALLLGATPIRGADLSPQLQNGCEGVLFQLQFLQDWSAYMHYPRPVSAPLRAAGRSTA